MNLKFYASDFRKKVLFFSTLILFHTKKRNFKWCRWNHYLSKITIFWLNRDFMVYLDLYVPDCLPWSTFSLSEYLKGTWGRGSLCMYFVEIMAPTNQRRASNLYWAKNGAFYSNNEVSNHTLGLVLFNLFYWAEE